MKHVEIPPTGSMSTGEDLAEYCNGPSKEQVLHRRKDGEMWQMLRKKGTQGWAPADGHQGRGRSEVPSGYPAEVRMMHKETLKKERAGPATLEQGKNA